MRGLEKNCTRWRKQTDRHTDGHGDSMTNSAQWGRVGENLLCGGASRWRVCYQRGLPRLVYFQIASFTKVVLIICLVTEMIDWKQKLKNQWVQIEISRVQAGKPGNFLPLGSFPFQYSGDMTHSVG